MRRLLPFVLMLVCLGPALAQTDMGHRLAVLAGSSRGLAFVRAVTLPELEKLGYAEGRNLVIDPRIGSPEDLPGLARAIVAASPDAIVALNGAAMIAVHGVTGTIPIVIFGADPVELGLAQSLARPGANVTGLLILAPELDAKRLELSHGPLPTSQRIATLIDSSAPGAQARRRGVSEVAARSGSALSVIDASGAQAYEGAFAAMHAAGAQALAIGASATFARDGALLAENALKRRLPTMCQWREMAEQGCLLSYGPSRPDPFKRTASFVARILKGTSPSEIPIEQPTRFKLVVNMKAAKALGLDIDPAFLARADEVIE